jgi:gas vesicle protein
MENNHHKSGNNFLAGFVLGAVVGAGLVFLVGTKKGKKILKSLSEEGMENISQILERADKAVGMDEFEEDEEDASPKTKPSNSNKKQPLSGRLDDIKDEVISTVKPKAKRFFRGISKRVN